MAAHAVAGAPHPGQEVERDQHQVEEGDEQRQVLRAERAEHGALGERRRRSRKARGRSHSRNAAQTSDALNSTVVSSTSDDVQAVEAELVVDSERADPDLVGDELEPGVAGLEAGHERDRDPDRDQAAERASAGRPARAGSAIASTSEIASGSQMRIESVISSVLEIRK